MLKDGDKVDPLPLGNEMTVAFKVPSGMEGESFGILRWDGSKWVDESIGLENGYVMTNSNATGTFVLVAKWQKTSSELTAPSTAKEGAVFLSKKAYFWIF